MNHPRTTGLYIDTAMEVPAAKSAATPGRRRWFRWALVAVLFTFCVFFLDLEQVVTVLQRVSISWLLLILAVFTLDRLLMAWKWSVLLRALQVQVPLAALIRFYYQGTFAGTFLPSSLGGDLLRAYWVSQRSGATHEVYASLLMEKMIGFLSAVNWALVGIIVFAFSQLGREAAGWVGLILACALLMNGLFVISLQPQCHALVRWGVGKVPRFRLLAFFERLVEAYARYRKCRGALAWNGVLTVMEHGLQLLIVMMMARGLGIQVDTVLFLAVTAAHLLIYRLPISPDGWGVGEVTAIGLYGLIGVTPESAFALALFSHVLQMLVVLPGLWFLWRSGGISRDVKPAVT